jgi:hypothetical protein
LIWVNQAGAGGTPYKLYVGNAGVPGGIDILQSSVGNKLRYNTVNGKIDLDLTTGNRLNTDDIIQIGGATNKFFTNELAQDAVGAMFSAGTMSGIQFVYDDVGNRMNVTVTGGGGGGGSGITAVVDDPAPHLGGTLDLSNQSVIGTGNINIDGYAILTGTLAFVGGMDSNISMNGYDITGEGNITLGGDASFTGTLISQTGLGSDLSLNGNNLTGFGDINVSGMLSVNGLGADLSLNGNNLTGLGNIETVGTLSVSQGLGANLTLNSNNIIGTGNINITGGLSGTTVSASTGLGSDLSLNGHNITGTGNISIINNIAFGVQISGTSSGNDTFASLALQGSRTSNTPLQNNDTLGSMYFTAWNGTSNVKGSLITSKMTSDFSGSNFSTDTIIFSLNADGNYRSFTFKSNGLIGTGGLAFTPGSTNDINNALPTPAAGYAVFNSDLSSMQVSNGSAFLTIPTVVAVPSTATSTGKPGQIAYSSTWIYVCVATNTWVRSALATW